MPAGNKIATAEQDVAAAGTAEALVADTLFTSSVEVLAKSANVGDVYIGDSTIDNTGSPLTAGQSLSFDGPRVNGNTIEFDLNAIFVDADNNDDGVFITYIVSND